MSGPKNAPAVSLDTLAAMAPDVGIGVDEADQIADLARRITMLRARQAGLILTDADAAPYRKLPPERRAAQRAAVVRVVEALVLLGWIEQP